MIPPSLRAIAASFAAVTDFAIVVGVGAAIALASGCTGPRSTCQDLERALARCGLPAQNLECTRIDDSERDSLVVSIDENGCSRLSSGPRGEVDPRVCKLGNWPCPSSPTPAPGKSTLRHPIVLVSGIDGTPPFDWNPRIEGALRDDAHLDVHVIHLVPWAPTKERAADLFAGLEAVASARGWSKMNLFCYAVGGLDCRYLVSPGGLFADDARSHARALELVGSVTTIATPHRGTRVADAALEALANGEASELLAALTGFDAPSALDHGALATTLEGLTPEALVDFNTRIVDANEVYYQSFAGVSRALGRSTPRAEQDEIDHCGTVFHPAGTVDALGELLWASAPFSSTSLDENKARVTSPSDGMIAVESAKWGDFRGCIPADHYDVIGQIGHVTRDVHTGFEPVDFYRWVASDLAAKGY